MHNIVWFRSDLRVYDNPALSAALQKGSVVAIYLLSQKQWDQHSVAPAKRSLIVGQLLSLAEQLSLLNVPLKVIACSEFSQYADVITEQACLLGSGRVYYNAEYELNEKHCAEAVKEKLESVNVMTSVYPLVFLILLVSK